MKKVLILLALVVLSPVARCHDFYDEDVSEFRYDSEHRDFYDFDDDGEEEHADVFTIFPEEIHIFDTNHQEQIFEVDHDTETAKEDQ